MKRAYISRRYWNKLTKRGYVVEKNSGSSMLEPEPDIVVKFACSD